MSLYAITCIGDISGMTQESKLLAWIEPRDDDAVLAAFVGKPAAHQRAPAIRLCASTDEARRWVEREAAEFGLPIEWVTAAPVR